jgi:hypothetical protein
MKHCHFTATGLGTAGLLILLFPLLAAPAGGAYQLDDNKREYQVRSLGEESAESQSTRVYTVTGFMYWIEPVVLDGRNLVAFHREDKTKEGFLITSSILFDPAEDKLIQADRKTLTPAGAVLGEHLDFFTQAPNQFIKGVMHFNMLPLATARIDLSPDAITRVNFAVGAENLPWQTIFEVQGEEKVTVPAGEFNCVKLKMTIDTQSFAGGSSTVAKIFSALIPASFLWVDKAEPHTMIKMQGKFNGLAAPEQVNELVRLYRDKPKGPDRNEPK